MTISKRDLNLLLILAGIIVFLLAYFLIYQDYTAKTDALTAENATLSARKSELRTYADNAQSYQSGIEESKKTVEAFLDSYPSLVRTEDMVMLSVAMEKKVGIRVVSAAFPEPTKIADLPYAKTDEAGALVPDAVLTAMRADMSVSCTMTYAQMKALLSYLYGRPTRIGIDSMNLSYDTSTGNLTGSLVVNEYYLQGSDRPQTPLDIPGVSVGTDNLFGSIR